MRTVTTETVVSPSICLAIDSTQALLNLKHQFDELGCECTVASSLAELSHWLDCESPQLAIVSLDYLGQCGLDFFREQSELFDRVPVAFYADDPSTCFDKSLAAIRLGAVDVIAGRDSDHKLRKLANFAYEQLLLPNKAQPEPTLQLNTAAESADQDYPRVSHVGLEHDRDKCLAEQFDTLTLAGRTGTQGQRPTVNGNGFATPLPSNGQPAQSAAFSVDVTNSECPDAAARRAGYDERIRELESWILGSSPAMQSVRSTIAEVAETKANVMIYGASGTGKEMVATAVHRLSKRSEGPFEPVNMTEIPHDLAESLLFGHEKGAFTGADFRQIGVCEAADGGTLFLDEIGEMALQTQPKLLRFLQEGTVKRIGSRNFKNVDVRVITATNRDPETIVKEGRMREDLFFRLHVVPIYIPPLQDRPEDIEQLAMLFLRRYVKAYKRTVEGFSKAALDVFRMHDWPGNVRQLENVVERLVVFAKGRVIDVPDIPADIHATSMFGQSLPAGDSARSNTVLVSNIPYAVDGQDPETAKAIASMSAIQRTERAAIVEALHRAGGHVIDAANLLGLGQATVYRKIKQYHIPHQRRRRRRSPK